MKGCLSAVFPLLFHFFGGGSAIIFILAKIRELARKRKNGATTAERIWQWKARPRDAYIYRHKQHQVHHRWIAIGDPTIDGNPSWLLACIDCV
jgi:uncharacterized protein YnzC (UPF0291/DUF896 family)